jgi:hypothetical protein
LIEKKLEDEIAKINIFYKSLKIKKIKIKRIKTKSEK